MASLVTRKEIRSLPVAELEKLRHVFKELQAQPQGNNYQKIAGYHGVPGGFCKHSSSTGNPLFLPWHRAYILALERALQAIDPTVSLPYWDWTSTDAVANGIPDAYRAVEYQLADGTILPNPLFSAPIADLRRETRRNARQPVALTALAGQIQLANEESLFMEFTNALEGPHNTIHGWVRKDMRNTDYAAYDPIFWAHHANIDRQWAQWQDSPNNAPPPQLILDQPLEPFGVNAAQVIDFRNALGYEYEYPATPIPSNLVHVHDNGNFRMRSLESMRIKVLLHVQGIGISRDAFNVDIFINQPDANVDTPLFGNEHYAGSFGLFGMGEHMHSHEGVPDAHRGHHHAHEMGNISPGEQVLDITNTVETVVREGEEIYVKLVATDGEGEPVSLSQVPLQGLSIERR